MRTGVIYYYFVALAAVIVIPKLRFRLDHNNYQYYALIVEKLQDAELNFLRRSVPRNSSCQYSQVPVFAS